jgi:hypothetical protein
MLFCFCGTYSQTADLAFTNCQRSPIPAKLTGVIRLGEPAPVVVQWFCTWRKRASAAPLQLARGLFFVRTGGAGD